MEVYPTNRTQQFHYLKLCLHEGYGYKKDLIIKKNLHVNVKKRTAYSQLFTTVKYLNSD